MKDFKLGVKDSIPIALGYLSVSFSFGILAMKDGLTIFQAVLTSITNITSAGQFAGIGIIAAGGTILEMIMTQFIINLRYALMSLSLSQKLDSSIGFWKRCVIAFANTDEVFAVAMSHTKDVSFKYMVGLQLPAIFGWTLGTALGAIACELLPLSLTNALSVALYGMFIAIVLPAAKKSRPIAFVALTALILSSIIYYVPFFKGISAGISIIICTIAASIVGAIVFPVNEEASEEKLQDEGGAKA